MNQYFNISVFILTFSYRPPNKQDPKSTMNVVRQPPGPGGAEAFNSYRTPPNPATSGRNEMRSIKSEDIPRHQSQHQQVMRQVDVECVAPYRDNSWHNIGRTGNGLAADSVQYCQASALPLILPPSSSCKVRVRKE